MFSFDQDGLLDVIKARYANHDSADMLHEILSQSVVRDIIEYVDARNGGKGLEYSKRAPVAFYSLSALGSVASYAAADAPHRLGKLIPGFGLFGTGLAYGVLHNLIREWPCENHFLRDCAADISLPAKFSPDAPLSSTLDSCLNSMEQDSCAEVITDMCRDSWLIPLTRLILSIASFQARGKVHQSIGTLFRRGYLVRKLRHPLPFAYAFLGGFFVSQATPEPLIQQLTHNLGFRPHETRKKNG